MQKKFQEMKWTCMKNKLSVQNPTLPRDTCRVSFFAWFMLDYITKNKRNYNIEWHANGHLFLSIRNGCLSYIRNLVLRQFKKNPHFQKKTSSSKVATTLQYNY
jgi:hypothetical protein